MILSVSRRTDIPAFYSDWFFNRLKDGFVCVRNPVYPEKVSMISLDKEVIDCIVFWTKNAEPMLNRLDELAGYKYYFQYTLNPYGTDVEPVIGADRNTNIDRLIRLSEKIGPDKVIWRYDPIFTNQKYTKAYHIKSFQEIAEALRGHVSRVVISFLDLYGQTKRNMPDIDEFDETECRELVRCFVKIAKENGMTVESCAEKLDLSEEGVIHGHCIDKNLIEEIIGYRLTGGKDKGQRQECGCMESIDIGVYNTCQNGCRYCYAVYGTKDTIENAKEHDPKSPFLCGTEKPTDIKTERKMRSLRKKR